MSTLAKQLAERNYRALQALVSDMPEDRVAYATLQARAVEAKVVLMDFDIQQLLEELQNEW